MAGTLLFVYVASIGPVAVYCDAQREKNQALDHAMRRFYYPVIKLVSMSSMAEDAATWYCKRCERIMYPERGRPPEPQSGH